MSAEDAVSFQFLAENSTDVICRAGADAVLHYVSPSSLRVLGWKPEEMIGKRPDDFVFGEDRSFLPASLDGSAVRMRKKDGTTAWIEIRHHATCDSSTGENSEKIIVMRDITERKHLQDQLSLLESTDSRNGLPTHRAFDEALEREWNRTLREGAEISLLLLDFDHFRRFHDWRQHREGDHCLGEAATAVIGALRITDFAGPHGAENIAIILPSTDAAGAVKVAEKVRSAAQALRSPAFGGGKCEGRLMVSMGLATVSGRPGATARMPELLRLAADHALEKARQVRIKKPPARVTAQELNEHYR